MRALVGRIADRMVARVVPRTEADADHGVGYWEACYCRSGYLYQRWCEHLAYNVYWCYACQARFYVGCP